MKKLFTIGAAGLLAFAALGAQTPINIGTTPNDGTGDPIRSAFIKINTNFTDVYSQLLNDTNAYFHGGTASNLVIVDSVAIPTNAFTSPFTYTGTNGTYYLASSGGWLNIMKLFSDVNLGGGHQPKFMGLVPGNTNLAIVYPKLTASYTAQTGVLVYPNALTLADVNGNYRGAIDNGAQHIVPIDGPAGFVLASGNVGPTPFDSFCFMDMDGLGTDIVLALGPMFGGDQNAVEISTNAPFGSLYVLPNGDVSMRAISNQFGAMPFRVPITLPTFTATNAPTLQTTNATPGDVTITAGTIVTAPTIWITVTNNGVAYSFPAWK